MTFFCMAVSNVFMERLIFPSFKNDYKHYTLVYFVIKIIYSLVMFYFQQISITLVLEEKVEETGVSVIATYHSET